MSDNPFASIEAIRGSPPLSPQHVSSAPAPVTQHIPLIPTVEPFILRNGAALAIPSKLNSTAGDSPLSGHAKPFIPRSSTTHSVQFSGIPFEDADRVPGRMTIRKMENAFVGAAGIIGGGA